MLDGTFLEQENMYTDCRVGGWNIDLRPPEFAAGFPYDETLYSYTLKLYWNFDGTGSNATDVVLNAYSDTAQENIILTEPTGYPELSLLPAPAVVEEIGTIGVPNSWNIENNTQSTTYSSSGTVDIGENESGTIVFYVTGFDNACNPVTNDLPLTVSLNPWMTSKGGFVYSGGNVGSQAKDYTTSAAFLSAGANPILRHVLASELDIATESVTSRANTIYNFIHPDFGAVRASGIYNSNSETTGWYEYLKGRLYQQEAAGIGVKRFILDASGVKTSDFCGSASNYCYHQTDNGDFSVPKSFEVCDKKTLIMASGDIYLEPDIFNGGEDNLNGCIFLAGGSIYVGAGEWKTDTVTFIEQTEYDYLEAYLLAEDKINIELVDVVDQNNDPIFTRDGLEIYGGLVAFGKNVSGGESAVQVNRSFGLWNAYIPVVATTWDPRYAKIAEGFFGPVSATYKREVGFKPY
jgi:hypothetical protein